MTANERKRLDAFEDFFDTNQFIITNALLVYAERMRADSTKIMGQYDAIKDDPEARAAQDQSLVTTEGLRMSAEMIEEAAERADKTREILEALLEYE